MEGAAIGGVLLFELALVVLMIASMWRVFTKAGQPGWAAIVPIYNMVVLMQVAKKPIWWVLLMFIPLVNLVILILASIAVAENFRRGVGFALGLAFLGFIFYPILAWGDSTYVDEDPSSTFS